MRRQLSLFFVFFISWVFACCYMVSADATESVKDNGKYGGIYRAPLLNNPSSLDPAHAKDIYAIEVIQQVFDGLVQYSPDLFVIPALARNWQLEENGKTYRFFLREEASFHNGSPVTASDVIFSFCRLLRVSKAPTILPHLLKIKGAKDYRERKTDYVAGLEAPDDKTVIIRLEQPYAPFLVALGIYQAKIVPREVVTRDEKRFGEEPIGSGPFKFLSWEPNKLIKLKTFDNYCMGRAYLDGIEFVVYPGIQIEDVWADFENGKLEQTPVYGKIWQKAKDKQGIRMVHRPSLGLQFYGINCQKPLLKDQDFRAALSLAINREELIPQLYNGQFEVAKSILPPGLPGYQPDHATVLYDLEKARKHLLRAVGNNASSIGDIEIVSNSQSPIALAELEFVRKSWAKLGINLKPKFIPDWAQFKAYLNSDSLQIYRFLWFADIPDPDDILRPLFSSESPSNYTRYRNEEVDQMLEKALGIIDPMERASFYQQIEGVLQKADPIIPLNYWSTDLAYQDTIQGIHFSALGSTYISFHRVWLHK